MIYPSPTISPDSVRWSADGTKLSFIDGGAGYVVNADGSSLHKDASRFPPDAGRGPISPDGTKRIYTAPVAATAPSTQIFISNLNGGDPRQLTNLTADCPFPATNPADRASNPVFQPPAPFQPGFLVWQSLPPISCNVTATGTNGSGQQYIDVTVQDTSLGVKTIGIRRSVNANIALPPFSAGSNAPIVVRATKIDQGTNASVVIQITDLYNNMTSCEQHFPARQPNT